MLLLLEDVTHCSLEWLQSQHCKTQVGLGVLGEACRLVKDV
jgi:hypothetical protein